MRDAVSEGRATVNDVPVRHCEFCGVALTPRLRAGGKPQKICGQYECRAARWRARNAKKKPRIYKPAGECAACGTPLPPRQPHTIGKSRTTCSAACKKERRRQIGKGVWKRHGARWREMRQEKWKNATDAQRAKKYEYTKRWREANPEDAKAAARRWRQKHPAAVKAYARAGYARRSRALGRCSREQWQARLSYYGHSCWVPGCGRPWEQVDHVVALKRGGTNWPSNLRPVCASHNASRKALPVREFLKRIAA